MLAKLVKAKGMDHKSWFLEQDLDLWEVAFLHLQFIQGHKHLEVNSISIQKNLIDHLA